MEKLLMITIIITGLLSNASSYNSYSNVDNYYYKQMLYQIALEQVDSGDKFSGKEVRYAYVDVDNDDIKELIWITPVSGLNLLQIPVFIIYSNGEYKRFENYIYMTKSVDNLTSFVSMTDDNDKIIYRIGTNCYSTGEDRTAVRYFDSDFNVIKEFMCISCNNQNRYYIDAFKYEGFINETDVDTYNTELKNYNDSLIFCRSIIFTKIDSFLYTDIESFIDKTISD
jgi:uncharacterized protein YpmB